MNCFIIRADGTGLKNAKVIDYNFPLDLQHAGSASIVGNYVGYEDGVMICVPLNYGWRIATCSPSMAEEKTTVKLESILTFFDREINIEGIPVTDEDTFLNGAISLFKTAGDDYLKLNNIESSISSGLDYSPPKVTEYGTFNLKTYINELIDSNYLKLTVSIFADGKKLGSIKLKEGEYLLFQFFNNTGYGKDAGAEPVKFTSTNLLVGLLGD